MTKPAAIPVTVANPSSDSGSDASRWRGALAATFCSVLLCQTVAAVHQSSVSRMSRQIGSLRTLQQEHRQEWRLGHLTSSSPVSSGSPSGLIGHVMPAVTAHPVLRRPVRQTASDCSVLLLLRCHHQKASPCLQSDEQRVRGGDRILVEMFLGGMAVLTGSDYRQRQQADLAQRLQQSERM